MRATLLTLLVLAVAGCKSCPIPKAPELVRVAVPTMVPVPEELTAPTPIPQKQANTCGEAVRLANTRKVAAESCNADKAQIRALGEEPQD